MRAELIRTCCPGRHLPRGWARRALGRLARRLPFVRARVDPGLHDRMPSRQQQPLSR